MANGSKPTVYGVGLVALDLVVSSQPNEPVSSWVGGTCGNVTTILSFLGWDAYPIARLNGDSASNRVKEDFLRWGVHLDFAECFPTTDTPIIVQKINLGPGGEPSHVFNWECLQCGRGLPRFRSISSQSAHSVSKKIVTPSVLFVDRLSESSLIIARHAAKLGSLIVFEPSMVEDSEQMREMLHLAHIVKYSDQRLGGLPNYKGNSFFIEIQSLGREGLRFRQRVNQKLSQWVKVSALSAPSLKDTCGSGDWLTAGFLSKTASRGLAGFKKLSIHSIREAFVYGQALSAWNCGFEGARGGMYVVGSKKLFSEQINSILHGKRSSQHNYNYHRHHSKHISCPCCTPQKK